MATLNIYTALGPSRELMFATIHVNRDLLENAAIFLAPIHTWNHQFIPAHAQPCMQFVPLTASAPEQLTSFVSDIGKRLDAGINILQFSGVENIRAHQSFARFLRQGSIPSNHAVKLLFGFRTPSSSTKIAVTHTRSPFPKKTHLQLVKCTVLSQNSPPMPVGYREKITSLCRPIVPICPRSPAMMRSPANSLPGWAALLHNTPNHCRAILSFLPRTLPGVYARRFRCGVTSSIIDNSGNNNLTFYCNQDIY